MSKYTMAQIVALTGINAHTLRKWETRYNIIDPDRTQTNIRFYSATQLKKLLNISLLMRNGYKISSIDKMSESEIHEAVEKFIPNGDFQAEINALIEAMIDMDEKTFDLTLKEQILKNGLLTTILKIVYPFLNQVGVLWGMDKVMPAQEHLISNLIRRKMLSAIDLLPYPRENTSSIVMFLTEDENHELGLLLAYYLARELGWKVYYLGQNVPLEDLKLVADEFKPNALFTMFVTPITKSLLNQLKDLCSYSNVRLYFSGNPAGFDELIENNKIKYLSSPNEFIDFLKQNS